MKRDSNLRELERLLVHALDRHAPQPDSGLAERLLRRTAETSQRRRWSLGLFPGLQTAFAAAAAIVAAIAVGVALAAVPGNVGDRGPASATPPVADLSPPPSSSSSEPSVLHPTDSATPAASPTVADERCINEGDGYSVAVPDGWWHNGFVEGNDLGDIQACRFFATQPIDIRPASQASGMAIAIRTEDSGVGRPAEDPRDGRATTVDGRDARIVESVATQDGPFEPAGTRTYAYWIQLKDGWLVAATSDGPSWAGHYEENVAQLDAMMKTLRFTR